MTTTTAIPARTSNLRRRLPDPARFFRACALGLVVAAALLAVASASASEAAKTSCDGHRRLDRRVLQLRPGRHPVPRPGPRSALGRGRLPATRRGELPVPGLDAADRARGHRRSWTLARLRRRDQRRLQRLGGRLRRRSRHAGAAGGRGRARRVGHAARGVVERVPLRAVEPPHPRRRPQMEEPRRRRLERVQPRPAVVQGRRSPSLGVRARMASRDCCGPSFFLRRSFVPTFSTAMWSDLTNFPLARRCRLDNPSRPVSDPSGVVDNVERVFSSSCTGALSASPSVQSGRGRSGRIDSRAVSAAPPLFRPRRAASKPRDSGSRASA